MLEGGKGENQSSIRVVKGCEKTGHLGKYYIINTYSNMYILIYIPKRSLTRNPALSKEGFTMIKHPYSGNSLR